MYCISEITTAATLYWVQVREKKLCDDDDCPEHEHQHLRMTVLCLAHPKLMCCVWGLFPSLPLACGVGHSSSSSQLERPTGLRCWPQQQQQSTRACHWPAVLATTYKYIYIYNIFKIPD